jgi:hypothetical protein
VRLGNLLHAGSAVVKGLELEAIRAFGETRRAGFQGLDAPAQIFPVGRRQDILDSQIPVVFPEVFLLLCQSHRIAPVCRG